MTQSTALGNSWQMFFITFAFCLGLSLSLRHWATACPGNTPSTPCTGWEARAVGPIAVTRARSLPRPERALLNQRSSPLAADFADSVITRRERPAAFAQSGCSAPGVVLSGVVISSSSAIVRSVKTLRNKTAKQAIPCIVRTCEEADTLCLCTPSSTQRQSTYLVPHRERGNHPPQSSSSRMPSSPGWHSEPQPWKNKTQKRA